MAAKKTKTKATRKSTSKTVTSKKKPGKEGREGQRVPIQLLVDYKAEGHYLFDFCRDLGSGGVFIETNAPLSQGSPIDLTFTIPDSKETLMTKGKVIWVQTPVENRHDLTPGMGVQFEAFTGKQRKILEDFVGRYHGDKFKAGNKDENMKAS